MISVLFSAALMVACLELYKHFENRQEDTINTIGQAIQTIQHTLAQERDLTAHHFQPCRQCGYPLNLERDQYYCIRSDLYKMLHPETVLDDLYVFREYAGKDLARYLMQTYFYDTLPKYVHQRNYTVLHRLPQTTSLIYPYAKNYFRTHRLGTQAGCLFQKYAHIPGQDEIALKSNSSTHFVNYIKALEQANKSEQCIEDAKFYKKTFRMWSFSECRQLFDIINSEEYQNELFSQGIKYILKTNRHLGNGIMLLDQYNEAIIRRWYNNGEDCGKNTSSTIIQEYIRNPYLYNGHKMEFRAYFMIASTNPPTLYGYKVALIKQCALKFNLQDFTKQGHVCNTAVTKNLKDQQQNNDDTLYIDWNLEELQDMLYQQGRIKSKEWLDKEFRPQIYRKVINLYMSIKDYLFEDSRVSEFFGVDFIMDDNLRLWILECNRNPNFLAVTQGRKDKFGKLLYEMMELNQLYIRSKYKRIREFIEQKLIPNNNQMNDELKKEFLNLQEDRLEPEFSLPENSSFELVHIISNKGEHKFTKYMNEQCLL